MVLLLCPIGSYGRLSLVGLEFSLYFVNDILHSNF
jgi:hypothetical protein